MIESAMSDEGIKDMSNTTLITITTCDASAKPIKNEFKVKAGPTSTWRWYMLRRLEREKNQMRFPNAKTIEDLSYFTDRDEDEIHALSGFQD